MALQDIRLRYRGSLLGPFWLTLNTGIMIGAMGVIYPLLFKMEMRTYLAYLTIGLVVWQYISSIVNEGSQTFLSASSIIAQNPMPFSIHAYRLVYRNLIVLAHNAVIIPIVLVIYDHGIDSSILLVIPALLLLAINGVSVSILLGIASARFRDVPPIVSNFMQVLFFVTPIFWSVPADLGRWRTLFELNPLFAAVDVIRAPLLNTATAPYSWIVLIATTLLSTIIGFALFARFRPRIAYWL